MRVLMVSHSAVIGGSNQLVASLLAHHPDDIEPVALVFLKDGPARQMSQVPTTLIPHARFRQAWRHPGTIRSLGEAIRATQADLVFSHFATAHVFAGLAARRVGVPELWWHHATYEQSPGLIQVAGRLRSGAVICSGEQAAADHRSRFPRTPVVAIHPGVERHQVGERHHHVATDSVVIGVVGRLQRLKRIELAIRAMPAVLRGAPQATLRIVGAAAPGTDEGYEDELRSEAQALGVAAHVEFTGHAEDAASAIRELDILVHCASVESFGMVPVEALAHGIPVVGADAGGLRETVRDGVDGLRIDPADSEALAAAVLSLAAEPARRAEMGSQGRTRVLAAFTAERTAQRAWRVASAVHRGEDPVTALDEAP